MKKNTKWLSNKVLFLSILLLSVILEVQAENSSELDNIKISVTYRSQALAEVLEDIAIKSNLGLTFNEEDIIQQPPVTYNAKKQSVSTILKTILKETSLAFKYHNETIVLYKENKTKPLGQKSIIRGTVKDKEGLPLAGVTVQEKNTNNGTVTDFDGKFDLKLNNPQSLIVFSSIGFLNLEMQANLNEPMDVVLTENIDQLQEVVVVGYGTQKKKDLTGAIAHLTLDGKENAPNPNLITALQGIAPGLNATGGSSAGSSGSLSIRGKTSLSASDSPLIVLDGIIYNGSISDLNVNDIAAIDVLKDASAAAVFGSRSANGVIVITTKRGKSDKPVFNFNTYVGVQDLLPTDRTQIMNGEEYAVRLVDYYYQQDLYDWYDSNPTDPSGRPARPDVTNRELVSTYLRTEEEQQNYLNRNEIDWLDEVFQTGLVQSYNLSVSGNSEKTNYYLSGSYTDQEGILKNDNFSRFTLYGKFEYELTDWFDFEFAPQYIHRDYSGISANLSEALTASPLGNKYDENGDLTIFIANESTTYNPLGNLLIADDDQRDFVNLNFKGKFKIPFVKGLKYEINYNKNYYFGHTYRYYPTSEAEGSKVDGYGYKTNSNEKKWLINNILTYNRTFGIHDLNLTLLHSEEEVTGEGTTASGTNFASEKLGFNALENAETQTASSSAYREFTRSFMGRVSYSLKDRYLLTGTIRRDGFSGFGKDNKWGNFPSASLGWIISEESFLENANSLDYLKLRVSYGINGNQGIGRYKSQSSMATTEYVFDGHTAIGIYSNSLGNQQLGWEKTNSTNVGVDFEFFKNRLSGSIDGYVAKTTDVLVQRDIPRASGNSSVWTNIGGMKNHGFEIALNSINISNSDFTWRSGVNFSLNRNKITKLYEGVTQDIGNGWFVNEPINAIYNYEVNGIWQEEDLFNGNIYDGYYPGQWHIVDQNGDGEIDAENDRTIFGTTDPNYRFSINNSFSYKNFSFSFFINAIQGGDGYYLGSNTSALTAGGTDYAYRQNRSAIRPYWRPDHPVNNAPGMYYNPAIAPSIYQDRSFVRLQDVNLSYKLHDKFIELLGLRNARLYVSGKNLHTWTNWSGWDPEVNNTVFRSVVLGLNADF
ncbi:SusC/RagA family TonB-linked outer membrane protein [Zunongwangia pacifica]|uniref:TonB-dependent receptor n=1 Tax=Zunongwangia pacifica TaxID=2911062 RepID=A0A9X2CMM4_9FLAO|nr:TonB-dependent receptor [Zunongwangia pacifica]MCL6217679.1 TonB-dependent receptor [Zunongwangia pacifica]